MSMQDITPAVEFTQAKRQGIFMETLRTTQGAIGAGMVLLVALLVLVGPLVAPHKSSDYVARPYSQPSSLAWLGTDYQGHDVLSVVLHGGLAVIGVAACGALIAIALAALFGLLAGSFPGRFSRNALRVLDIALIFPPIVLGLLVLTRAGTSPWLLFAVTVITQFPPTARVFWGATTAIAQEDFIEAARALGLSKWELMIKEVAPNVLVPILAEIPIRFIYCIAVVSTLAFLGFGAQPPAIDWGTMINQNKGALTLQPWPVVAPVACIAVIAIGANLFADAMRARIVSIAGRGTL